MMHRVPNTITLRDRKEHGRRRRILGPGFSDQAIKSYEGKIRVIVGRFCAALRPSAEEEKEEDWSASRNIAQWSTWSFSLHIYYCNVLRKRQLCFLRSCQPHYLRTRLEFYREAGESLDCHFNPKFECARRCPVECRGTQVLAAGQKDVSYRHCSSEPFYKFY